MSAGQSALRRSRELHREADALFELAELTLQQARNYLAASASEKALAGRLRHLDALGWVVLEDRLWPGSKRANVDFILVGPGGVVVLDAKDWAEVEVRDGGLYRGQSREDGEVDKLHRLIDQVVDCLQGRGLTASSVTAAAVFTGRRLRGRVGALHVLGDHDVAAWLGGLRHRLGRDQVVQIADSLAQACPEMPVKPQRALAAKRRRIPAKEIQNEVLIDADELAEQLLESAMAGPIEDWMTFLHPEQNRLVRSAWNGPARVRGPAGTGKTVVGLHRAVYLAQRSSDPVLVVSFVKTLPVVLGALAGRLWPSVGDRIEFIGVHQLAYRCLELTGEMPRVDLAEANRAFRHAWHETGSARRLGRVDERPAYWREEIDHVIKGRGVTERHEYEALRRVGRKTPMRVEDRCAMWDLYVAYEGRLTESGSYDFNDLLLRARDAVERFPSLYRYSSVIVDEVQDLDLAAVRFLCALAGDGIDQLLFIGDGQQSVYPGGFTLAEAGVTVTGRAAVLKVNYRNTAEILAEAQRMVSSDTFEDLDDLPEAGDRDVVVRRHGYAPIKAAASSRAALAQAAASQLQRTHDVLGTRWGDMAVLCERRGDVRRYRDVLRGAGIPTVELTEYDGVTTDRVKVGTIKRAKGLEFAYVLLPNLTRDPPGRMPGELPEAYAERVERWRRELYVGMTRARDGLWLGYLETKGP